MPRQREISRNALRISPEDLATFSVKKLNAEKLGCLIWRMNSIAASVHHVHVHDTWRYDRSNEPEHWFMKDIMTRDVSSTYITEKWKDWVLVYADGTEQKMVPGLGVSATLAAFREKNEKVVKILGDKS